MSVLEHSEIDYMLTGAFASSMQGEPRSTHDIDFVVLIETSDIGPLIRSFPAPDFYIAEVAIREAIETGGVFDLIDTVTGDKADFWMLTQDPFDQSRSARKQTVQVFGISLTVSTAEDTILQKLRSVIATGGNEKAFHDALRVYEVQTERLDRDYLEHWVDRLSLRDLWDRLLARAR